MIAYVQSQFYNSQGKALTINAGQNQGILRVPANRHGKIYRVAVRQSSGTATGFTFYVLDADTTVSGAPDRTLCQLADGVAVSSGQTGTLRSDIGIPYRNKNNEDAFYVLVTLAGNAGATLTFDVCATWSAAES